MTNFGAVTLVPLYYIPLVVTNFTVYSGIDLQSPVDEIWDFDPPVRLSSPTLGQLWPRQMWHYNDDLKAPASILGYATLHHIFYTGHIITPITKGQIWPRGDYIANSERQ